MRLRSFCGFLDRFALIAPQLSAFPIRGRDASGPEVSYHCRTCITTAGATMKMLSLKVPEALDRKLTAVVKKRGVPKSAVVRQALERYLDESGEIRSGSFLELAGDLVGSIKDAPADLSTNPRHLADFGK